MFNNGSNGYSLSDIAAATNGGNGMFGGGDGSAWWIIILFLFCFAGWGGNRGGGFGGGFGGNGGVSDFTYSLDAAGIRDNISNGFYAVNTGLLNGFAGTNAAVASGTQAIQSDICSANNANLQNTFNLSTQLNNLTAQLQASNTATNSLISNSIADINYKIASENCEDRRMVADGTRDIIENANNNTRQILDFLVQTKIDDLTSENAALRTAASQAEQNAYLINQLRPTAIPAYLTCSPYVSTSPVSNSCGCSTCGNQSYNF